MTIHRENLIDALATAIVLREEIEKQDGYVVDSALLAGWKELVNAVNQGDDVEFFD